jgi:hypothetical protein
MIEKKDIKTGDLGLVRGKAFLSKAIQMFTGSKVNHAFMFWWAYDELFCIEEDKSGNKVGLITTKYDDYLKTGKEIFIRRPKFDVDGSEYGKFMLPYLGITRYSFFDLLIAQPIYIISGKKLWIGGTSMDDNRTVCSGWYAFVCNHFTGLFPNWYKLSPNDLFIDENFVDL